VLPAIDLIHTSSILIGIALLLFPITVTVAALVALAARTEPRRRTALSVLSVLLKHRRR
jgi:hypothetical protein